MRPSKLPIFTRCPRDMSRHIPGLARLRAFLELRKRL